ncbi:RWD domain protein [Apiospora sp. TS-2023a]
MGSTEVTNGAMKLLPKELLEIQLGQIDLLLAMYAAEEELVVEDSARTYVEELKDWCASDDATIPGGKFCPSITMLLTLQINASDDDESSSPGKPLKLDITIPLALESSQDTTGMEEPPSVKFRLQQPTWMSKAEAAQLMTSIAQDENDMFSNIEQIKDAASLHLQTQQNNAIPAEEASAYPSNGPLLRVWFYFPSISTRAKRDDLVTNAPRYGLTGFLLAGKPGILCLEGGSAQAVDDYMRFIKTESWGDIPAHHKKVSERYRETLGEGTPGPFRICGRSPTRWASGGASGRTATICGRWRRG